MYQKFSILCLSVGITKNSLVGHFGINKIYKLIAKNTTDQASTMMSISL